MNKLFEIVIGVSCELFDLPTPKERERQARIIAEVPKEKPPIEIDGAVVYVGRYRPIGVKRDE